MAAVLAVHAGLAALILAGPRVIPGAAEQARTQLINVALPPPSPPPPERRLEPKRERNAGVAAKRARPSPVVAPPARLPAQTPVPSAPVAGTGTASTAGVATGGTGSGSGGAGSGRGGGGVGDGGGIGEDARLISGGLTRRDYRRLRALAASSGQAVLAILIGPDGRVAQCSTRQSSGNPALDAELCAIMQPRMRWSPARDRSGRPLTVGIYYTATWSRD